MKNYLHLFAFFLIASCASQDTVKRYVSPFEKSFLADAVQPTDPTDLRDLIATLPLFDMPPEERKTYVYYAANLTPEEVTLASDGSQTAAGLRKLPADGEYELRDGWPKAIGTDIYRLKRLENGWQVLSRRTLTTGIKMLGAGPG